MSIKSNDDLVDIYLLAAGRALVEGDDDAEDAAAAGQEAVKDVGGNPYPVLLALIARSYAEPFYVGGPQNVWETGNDLPVSQADMDDIVLAAAGRRAAVELFRATGEPTV